MRWVGDPVDVITGVLADVATEFTVPLSPDAGAIAWRRSYSTANLGDGPLGCGHRHAYDHRLRGVVDGWLYTQPDGEGILFPFAPPGVASTAASAVLQPTATGFDLRTSDGTTLAFAVRDVHAESRPRTVSQGASVVHLEYDAHAQLVQIANAGRTHVLRLDYLGARVATIWLVRHPKRPQSEPLALMRYGYSDAGDLIVATDRYGHAQRFTYDAAHRMLTRTDRSGYRFEYAYDGAGRCVVSRGSDGNGEVRLNYMPEAQATEVTRADGGAWLYRYDDSLSLTEIIDPYGGSRRFEYDERGRVAAETDPDGSTRWPIYDGDQIIAWSTAQGGVRAADSPTGSWPHREPSTPAELELGNLAARIVEGAPFASPGIEPMVAGGASIFSRLFAERDPRAAVRRDELGLLIEERGPTPQSRRWAYTPNAWVRSYVDHNGGRYDFEYAGGNMRTLARDPLGREIRYEYTPTDQIAAVTDPAGNRHSYRYDLRDALIEVQHGGQRVAAYKYDRAGNQTATYDARGQLLVAYDYGPGGLKSRRRLADGDEHRYEYTPSGQFARIDWREHVLEFAYTTRGQRWLDHRDDRGIEHRFAGSQLQATTVLDRFTTQYQWSDPETLEITDPLGNVHRVVLESHGVVTRHLACGASEMTQVDACGRVLEKHLFPVGEHQAVWRRKFAYSAEGELLAETDSARGETRYGYDAAHQLASVTGPDGQVASYAYDAAANLVEAPHLVATTVGPGNRVQAANGGELGYDLHNNVATWVRDGRTLRFHRDALGHLRAIDGLAAPWSAEYDPLGRRIRKTYGDTWTEYYWDSDRLAAEVHSSGRVRVFVYVDEFSLTPWLMIDYAALDAEPSSGTLHYLVTDQRGAPVAALAADGEQVWSADLMPYGQAKANGELDVSHRLAGQFYDPETGLCYSRFRYYSPELGRYLEEDPAGTGGGLNLYAYTDCPLVRFDPRGLAVCKTCGGKQQNEDHPQTKNPSPRLRTIDPKRKNKNAAQELRGLGLFAGRTTTEIRGLLVMRGFDRSPATNGGEIWVKNMPKGETAVVRVDPPVIRKPPKKFADEQWHAHKEIVPTKQVTKRGNFDPDRAVKLDDAAGKSDDSIQTHIPIVGP